jgi:sugar/nucleoside kinase (ribokinase family)
MAFFTAAQHYDVIAIGDVTTDVIVRLPSRLIHRRIDDEGRWLELPLGEKVPIDSDVTVAAGGSAANAAVALARLDLRVGLATFLAHDHVGLDLLSALHSESVDTRLIHVDSPAETNRSFVLSYEGERTILVRDGSFNYHWPYLRPNEVPAWLLLSSVGSGGLDYQDQIADWLDDHSDVRLAFHPGTFQIAMPPQRLARIYERAEVVICDAVQATEITGLRVVNLAEQLKPLRDLGSRRVVITDGSGGAVACDESRVYRLAPFPDTEQPIDRTGATDAFAATVVAAMIRGLPLSEGIRWAAVNFKSVSHQLGSQAGLQRADAILSELADAGDSFVADSR